MKTVLLSIVGVILALLLCVVYKATGDKDESVINCMGAGKTGAVNEGMGKQGIYDTSPPSTPVRLVFIHHSTGEHWLADEWGRLGLALKNNNYFVSDTNYNWGPDKIGSYTDIGNWWNWFGSSDSPVILRELYANYKKHSKVCYANMDYSRLDAVPEGENEIIMFKSCYPNSDLSGKPDDPIPALVDNPLKGEAYNQGHHTVANAKGIYISLLDYFKEHQEKLFILVTAPPRQDDTYAANARALNNWLVYEWLQNYPYKNVFVFDFYNVLTSSGGDGRHNDLGLETGNHHRFWKGGIQHQVGLPGSNTLAYADSKSDDHPNKEGNIKATEEFLPLLNIAYNEWKKDR